MMRKLTNYERKKLLDVKLGDDPLELWSPEKQSFEQYLDAQGIPREVEDDVEHPL